MTVIHETTAGQTVPAAQVRVTPQELAEAVAALEARKQAEFHRQAETISLGEAVQQLGLEMTPEELLAEVKAIQARRTTGTSARRHTHRSHSLLTTAIVLFCGFVIWGLTARVNELNRVLDAPPSDFSSPPAPAPPATVPLFEHLSALPDGQAAYCDMTTIKDLARGKSPSEVTVATTPKQDNSMVDRGLWTLIKSNGHIDVVCWATAENAIRAENGHHATVHLAPDISSDPTGPLILRRLPVSRFHDVDVVSNGDNSMMTSVSLPDQSPGSYSVSNVPTN